MAGQRVLMTRFPGVESGQWLHHHAFMPTLVRLSNATVTRYANDHLPPHFHVRMIDGREALVEIETLRTIASSLKARERAPAIAWAAANRIMLGVEWKELNP